ncbi:class I SAM-dependent methyltransferase, partial [Candidatus Pelagibacter sp.]|nr:class I SAM-dependent methyltransferase [Candidatus Pelagibacter sp.]
MSFDLAWEKHIYKKNLQINRYPFDWVVSSVVKYIDRKKIKKFKAVDLGCGTGNNLEFLAEIGFKEIIGIDGSQSAINFAKQKFSKKKKIKLIQGDFSKVIFDKKDFFLDRGSITHNKKKIITKLLKNIYKSLNKEGYFFSSLFSKRH